MKRKIIEIDAELCDGCGDCVPSCHEGAIEIVNGKARLVNDRLCDGIGDCLGECPLDAIRVVERDADAYDEQLVQTRKAGQVAQAAQVVPITDAPISGSCPGSAARGFARPVVQPEVAGDPPAARLGHWPVQLRLLHPQADFLANSDLLLCADCVPFAYADFHRRFLDGRAVAIACPKFDPAEEGVERLAAILAEARPRRLVVARMTVPCCGGLVQMAEIARQRAGSDVPIEVEVIAPDGDRLVD
ncbi:4Fe-4S ferredoxin [bacterium]|nr:MAG: 4Fe-4S ferredoxin [bacterium]